MISQRPLTENLIQYLKDSATAIPDNQFIDTSENVNTPQTYVMLSETGGPSRNYPDSMQQVSVQVRARAIDEYTARENIYIIWNKLQEKEHNVTLPGSSLYTGSASIVVARINVEQRPYYLGIIDSYHYYIFSVSVTYFAE